ncbi:SGNH hydrolase [Westerdykella ornata]|uniref:SGNH hydrolase n=1 Tax=Westerdykella ornata TaxID=318751 RepID=A0A6A6JIC4_WESOR|nr:SGNH hydrolase [Westerdykella ornata]KAF2276400.1 SGNH hydrolase [Westerdykella ornata]
MAIFPTVSQILSGLCLATVALGSPWPPSINLHSPRGLDLVKREGGPIRQIFSMMGDSFAAGVGAGKQWEQQETSDVCKRGDWSVGGQLWAEPKWWSGDQKQIQFIACSGARIKAMHKDEPKSNGHDPQDKEFAVAQNDAAVIWAGGNDAGFFKVLDGCVYYFFGPFASDCATAIKNALETIHKPEFKDLFLQTYSEIMDAAHPQVDTFTLYVLMYPWFFNAETDDCDDSQFCFWNSYCGEKMTKERRRSINDLTNEVNTVIRQAATEISDKFKGTNKIIKIIDTNPAFQDNRFCEKGSKEPNPNNPHNYFFQLYDKDVAPDGTLYDNLPSWPNATAAVGAASLPDAADCENKINSDADMDFGEHAACRISVVLAKNPALTLDDSRYPEAKSSDYAAAAYGRIFHPKSKGHAGVKDLIMAAIADKTPPPPPPPPFDNFNCLGGSK